jgi:hypothetical protein
MAERAGAIARLLAAVVPLGTGAAGLVVLQGTETSWGAVALAVAVMAAAGLIRVPGSTATDPTPALTVTASLPLIEAADTPVFDPSGQAAVVALGLAVLWVLRTARGDAPGVVGISVVRRLASSATYLLVFGALEWAVPSSVLGEWRIFVVFALAAFAAFAVELVSSAMLRAGDRAGSRRYRIWPAVRDLDAFTIIMATGGLFGLSFDAISWWAAVVAVLAYAFAHGAFHRFAAAKETYGQMLRALARIPEVGGHNAVGHSDRTAALAVAVAEDMGLRAVAVEEVEHAALMHDIGRVALNEPGVASSQPGESELATWGAEIVGEASILAGVADAVRRRHEPYRNPGEDRDPGVPLAARIIKVCSAFDEAVVVDGLSPLSAIERLHEGTVYEFDPAVVQSVRRVVERGTPIGTVDLR